MLSSNTALASMPGNVFLPAIVTGLGKDSVVNVTAVATVDRRDLDPHPVARVPEHELRRLDAGLRMSLGLT